MNELKALESLKQKKELSVAEMKLIQHIIGSVTDEIAIIFGTDLWVHIEDREIHEMCNIINNTWLKLCDRIEEVQKQCLKH